MLAMIFVVFGTIHAAADELTGHTVILGDQSLSMFPRTDEETGTLAVLTDIVFQRVGIVNALRDFTPRCNSVRVTYIAWGELQSLPLSATIEPGEHFSDNFIAMIEEESRYPYGGTAHGAALAEGIKQILATETSAVVFITNGEGRPVTNAGLKPVTVFKVSLFDLEAMTYLRDEFLPDDPYLIHADSAEDISLATKAALQFVDLEENCLG